MRALTNTAGATTDTYEYDAFGNSLTVSGSTPNSYLYRGEQRDSDLGLYYLRARYYNPLTGQFMSRDPNVGSPTDPKTLQKYLYASSDPVNGTDPSGRADLFEIAGEYSDWLDKYNQFSGPNDLGACLRNLYQSLSNSVYDIVIGHIANQGSSIGGQAANCEIDLLWGIINPLPTHTPWAPWQ